LNDNQGTTGDQPFIVGTPVYDAAGELVGTLSMHNVADQILVVDKGPFRTENLYVPLNEVERSDASAIHLSTPKDDLANK